MATQTSGPKLGSEPVSRRNALRLMLGGAIGLAGVEWLVTTGNFLWPALKGGIGSIVNVGRLSDFAPVTPEKGQPVHVLKIKSWVVNLLGYDKTLLALYQVCPHLGCTSAILQPVRSVRVSLSWLDL